MNCFRSAVLGVSLLFPAMVGLASGASAFCGVVEESASAKNAEKATNMAERKVRNKVRTLKNQYRKKLALGEKSVGCVGGAVSIDANGKQKVGQPSCKVTVSFCVNP